MDPYIKIWGSVLLSSIQVGCYSALSNGTETLMINLVKGDDDDDDDDTTITIGLIKHGESVGTFFGFWLSWPVANKFGRRKGLLLTTLLLVPLAIIFQLSVLHGNYPVSMVSSRLCTGLHIGAGNGLYLIFLFELYSQKWRANALIYYFLFRRVTSSLGQLSARWIWRGYDGDDFGDGDEGRRRWLWLITFALIPAAAQSAALANSMESPSFTAVQQGHVEQAQLDLERLGRPSSSSLTSTNNVTQFDEPIFGGAPRSAAICLALISLAFLFLNGPFHPQHSPLLEILENSDRFFKVMGDFSWLELTRVLLLVFYIANTENFSTKELIFPEFNGLLWASLGRFLFVLLVLVFVKAVDFQVTSAEGNLVSQLDVFIAAFTQAVLPPLLFTVLMELGGARERARLLVRSTLLAFSLLSGIWVVGSSLRAAFDPRIITTEVSYSVLVVSGLGGVGLYLGLLCLIKHAKRLMKDGDGGGGDQREDEGGGGADSVQVCAERVHLYACTRV